MEAAIVVGVLWIVLAVARGRLGWLILSAAVCATGYGIVNWDSTRGLSHNAKQAWNDHASPQVVTPGDSVCLVWASGVHGLGCHWKATRLDVVPVDTSPCEPWAVESPRAVDSGPWPKALSWPSGCPDDGIPFKLRFRLPANDCLSDRDVRLKVAMELELARTVELPGPLGLGGVRYAVFDTAYTGVVTLRVASRQVVEEYARQAVSRTGRWSAALACGGYACLLLGALGVLIAPLTAE